MRRVIPILIASLALAPLATMLAPGARAEDAPEDQSPAAKAYRDAWWAETGGGNLTQALEGYTRAAEAEGPASLKARALYKKAVILQRIGRTEDAIRTLERLAKDYPGEAAPQVDARARLAEWTAVDLKTSFAEWYQRYQYSPEFQAKIVDLVLKLGASDANVSGQALTELLTIGAPAIPALRQHVESANGPLREKVVMALLRLGDVPALAAIRTTQEWRRGDACWATLRQAGEAVRTRLKAEAKADEPFDQGLFAAFDGPVALLAWAATPAAKDVAERFLSYAFWWDRKQPEASVLRPLLLARVEDQALAKSARSQAWYWLLESGSVDVALAEAWAGGEDPILRGFGLSSLTNPTTPQGASADAPAALRRLLTVAPRWEAGDLQAGLVGAVLARLDAAPTGDDLDRLADELLAVGVWHNLRFPLSAAARAVLARMVDRARNAQIAIQLMQIWQRPGGGGAESDLDRLVGWVREARHEDARKYAVQALTSVPGEGPRRALALLAEPALSPDVRFTVFDFLARVTPDEGLMADLASRRALLSVLRTQERADAPRMRYYVGRFLELTWRSGTDAQRATAMEWVADPITFPRSLLRSEYADWGIPGHVVNAWLAAIDPIWPAWQRAWTGWTPAQRDAAVEGLGVRARWSDPSWISFLRACVHDASNGISKASRATLLRHLGVLSLDDLRAVYDLTTPKGTDDAVLLAFREGAPNVAPEPTPDLFEALGLGLRPDGNEGIARSLYKAFRHEPKVQRPLVEALLAHQAESIQDHAIDILAARESSDDLALWLKALALPSVDVRARAAAGLGRIAHPDATKALVAALDDPNSRVRDAAIASLEAIQKIEDLKKAWREKVR